MAFDLRTLNCLNFPGFELSAAKQNREYCTNTEQVHGLHFPSPTGAGVPAGEKNHVTDLVNGGANIFSNSSPCNVSQVLSAEISTNAAFAPLLTS